MAERPRVLVAGGAGVFGRLLARELLRDFDVVVAARDEARLQRVCRALGPGAQALVLDCAVPGALQRAARGSFAVACAAGPFQRLRAELPYETLRAGAHWLDIADAPGWVLPLLEDGALDMEARTAGLAVMTGLSSVPALTGALARRAAGELGGGATRARVTLYVGNRNTKGAGSIAAAIAGRFRDPVVIDLPVGRRRAYRFDSPDAMLLARALGVKAEFRVALEWGIAARITALAGRVGRGVIPRALATLATPFGFFGSTAGVVQAEVRDEEGHTVSWAARAEGQRLAVLPCALGAAWLLRGGTAGVIDPAEWLAPRLDALRAHGVRLLRRATPAPC